jgi:hypothetical protein
MLVTPFAIAIYQIGMDRGGPLMTVTVPWDILQSRRHDRLRAPVGGHQLDPDGPAAAAQCSGGPNPSRRREPGRRCRCGRAMGCARERHRLTPTQGTGVTATSARSSQRSLCPITLTGGRCR